MSGGKPVLAQRRDGYCIFWEKCCTIHPVKPHMCKNWPFIPGVLADIGNWKTMAASCPGIRKDAAVSPLIKYIREILHKDD